MSIYLPFPQEPLQHLTNLYWANESLPHSSYGAIACHGPSNQFVLLDVAHASGYFISFCSHSLYWLTKQNKKKKREAKAARGKNKRGGRKPGQLLRHVMVQNTEEGCMELWPQIASRSIFPPLKAPSAWVMAARQVLSEVLPQEMRDLGAERPNSAVISPSRGLLIFGRWGLRKSRRWKCMEKQANWSPQE